MTEPLIKNLWKAAVSCAVVLTAFPAHAAPLTLDDAIAAALQNHPDMRQMAAQHEQSTLDLQDAKSQIYDLTAGVSLLGRHADDDLLNTAGSAPTSANQAVANGTVTLSVPLFTGFKITNRIRAAEENVAGLEQSQEAARADLAYEVARAYWSLDRLTRLESIQQAAWERSKQAMTWTQRSFEQGRVVANEVDRAEVTLLNAETDLRHLRSRLEGAKLDLADVTGLPLAALDLASRELSVAAAVPAPIEAGSLNQDDLLAKHPRLLAAERQQAEAKAHLEAANGDRWPQVGFVTAYQHGNNSFDPVLASRGLAASLSGTWDARLQVQYNFFDNGQIGRAIARSQQGVKVAEAQLDKVRLTLRNEIQHAVNDARSAQDRLAIAQRSAVIAARTLKWVETRYQQGYALQIELIQAQNSLLSAETQQIEAFADYQIAQAALARVFGKTPKGARP